MPTPFHSLSGQTSNEVGKRTNRSGTRLDFTFTGHTSLIFQTDLFHLNHGWQSWTATVQERSLIISTHVTDYYSHLINASSTTSCGISHAYNCTTTSAVAYFQCQSVCAIMPTPCHSLVGQGQRWIYQGAVNCLESAMVKAVGRFSVTVQ